MMKKMQGNSFQIWSGGEGGSEGGYLITVYLWKKSWLRATLFFPPFSLISHYKAAKFVDNG